MGSPNVQTAHKGDASRARLQRVATSSVVYVIADLHFGDEATCAPGRRPFGDVTQMCSEIVRRWNSTVRMEDTVYVLGDIGKRNYVRTILHLNGTKHLVAGNGDDVVRIAACDLFASISVAKSLPGVLLTHIPVHPCQLRGRTINVHGHLHAAQVGDPRYVCVSVEQTNYTPVPLARMSEQLAR